MTASMMAFLSARLSLDLTAMIGRSGNGTTLGEYRLTVVKVLINDALITISTPWSTSNQ